MQWSATSKSDSATLQVCLGSELVLRAMSDASNGEWLEFIHLPSRSTGPAIFRFFMSGCLSQVEMSWFFCMGMLPVPPIISWDLLWVFKCKMAYLDVPRIESMFCHMLIRWYWWRICKYTLLMFIYIYMLQVYVGYGISRSHSHTLPVASDSMKIPTTKKGSCILGPGYTQQLDRSNKLKPISWSPGCLRTGFPFPDVQHFLYVLDWVEEFIPYHLYIATSFFPVKTWLERQASTSPLQHAQPR